MLDKCIANVDRNYTTSEHKNLLGRAKVDLNIVARLTSEHRVVRADALITILHSLTDRYITGLRLQKLTSKNLLGLDALNAILTGYSAL